MTKSVRVYRRNGVLFFRPFSKTTAGLWIGHDDVLKLNEAVAVAYKGEVALKSLDSSLQNVPHPTSWANVDDDPLWGLAGTKSWAGFVNGASLVAIEIDGNAITFTPYQNDGPKEGFVPLDKKRLQIPLGASTDDLGRTLLDAFALCQ